MRGGKMDAGIADFFARDAALLPLFGELAKDITAQYPGSELIVQNSQLAFREKKAFCWVWLPIRAKFKDRPEHYFILTFGLNRLLDSPRIVSPAEPYPNRWTHHVIISKRDDLDEELLGWIKQAYDYSQQTISERRKQFPLPDVNNLTKK